MKKKNPKPTVQVPAGRSGYITIRQDCFDAGCFEEECDVCHVHDEPANEDGNCDECQKG